MKRKMALLFVMITLLGCAAPSNEELLSRTGIPGEHVLKNPKSFSAITGSLSGNFFIGIGSISGSMDTMSKIMFAWCPEPNVIVSSEFPRSMFRVLIDNNKKQPSVEFIFNKHWLTIKNSVVDVSTWDNENPNEIISGTRQLQVIQIKISEADLKKEPALPQL